MGDSFSFKTSWCCSCQTKAGKEAKKRKNLAKKRTKKTVAKKRARDTVISDRDQVHVKTKIVGTRLAVESP